MDTLVRLNVLTAALMTMMLFCTLASSTLVGRKYLWFLPNVGVCLHVYKRCHNPKEQHRHKYTRLKWNECIWHGTKTKTKSIKCNHQQINRHGKVTLRLTTTPWKRNEHEIKDPRILNSAAVVGKPAFRSGSLGFKLRFGYWLSWQCFPGLLSPRGKFQGNDFY